MNRLVAALAVVLMCGVAVAAERNTERNVVVNGQQLSPSQLEQLDALAGTRVEDGDYWLDTQTGVWGYADDPTPRGRIGSGSGAGSGYSQPGGTWSDQGEGETDWSGFRIRE